MAFAIIEGTRVLNVVSGQPGQFAPPPPKFVVIISPGEACSPNATYVANGNPRFIMPPVSKTWTAYEFLNRFTKAERKAIRTKAKTDDEVADFELLASAANEIVSDDPTTVAGMNYLVTAGVISAQRKTEILS